MSDYPRNLTKLKDWRELNIESDWNEARMKYAHQKFQVFQHTILPVYHVPELTIEPDDYIPLSEMYENMTGSRYAYGYNEEAGDKGAYTKWPNSRLSAAPQPGRGRAERQKNCHLTARNLFISISVDIWLKTKEFFTSRKRNSWVI